MKASSTRENLPMLPVCEGRHVFRDYRRSETMYMRKVELYLIYVHLSLLEYKKKESSFLCL